MQGIANYWGDYKCGMPVHTMELMLTSLAALDPHYVMQTGYLHHALITAHLCAFFDVMTSGDTPPHALWEETQRGQIEFSRFAAERVAELVPGVPMFSCIGNHGEDSRDTA